MNESEDQYGVVGHPVAHSWSPFIHGMFARETGQTLTYRLFDVAPADFRDWVLQFFSQGGCGLNVTLPHKVAAAELATELTTRAERAGAVNTLVKQDRGLLGDNTDGAGLVRDLRANLGVEIGERRILTIGAGGAARGVMAPLLALHPAELVVANRTRDRASALAADFGDLGPVRGSGFGELDAPPFDLIINATSASLRGEVPSISGAVIGGATVCYDMAYGKGPTPFMRWALELRCARAEAGWGMLVEQAAESFRLWRGVQPKTAPVLEALRKRASS